MVVFLQVKSKFGVRYATLGFNEGARLDDGTMWATSFAIANLDDQAREKVAQLVRRAASAAD